MADGRFILDGYVRVSQVRGRSGDSFISPAVQRDRINTWAAAYGHQIAVIHEELDESGARATRPKLLEAIERVERGETQGIVVAKLDRFARSLIDGLRLIERIRKSGGIFVSVSDGFDLTTDTGRLVLRIMLSLAEFELDRVRSNWREAQTRAIMRGVHSSPTPFGYQREGKGGPLAADPVNGPVVTELFERRVAGAGPSELADWLTSRGARTGHGRVQWSHRAVKDLLRNRVYLGEAFSGDVRLAGAHEALVDRESFDAAQRPGVQFRPRSADPSPIAPLLRCAGCRYTLRAERRPGARGPRIRFSCRTVRTRSGWAFEEPARINDEGLQQWIVDAMFEALPRMQVTLRAQDGASARVQAAVDRSRAAYDEWRDDSRIQQRLGMDAYLDGLAARQSELNDAISELARDQARRSAVAMAPELGDLRTRWDDLSKLEQRRLLQSAIRCVFVRGTSSRLPHKGRLHVIWQGDSVDLPARGRRDWVPKPFLFND